MSYDNWDFYWRIEEVWEEKKVTDGYVVLLFIPDNNTKGEKYGNSTVTYTRATVFKAENVGQMIDSDLENENYHSLVGLGEYISDMLVDELGEEGAARIMERIVRERGSLLQG